MKLYYLLASRVYETRFWPIKRVFKTRFPWYDVASISYLEIESLRLDLYTNKILKKIKSLVQAEIHKKKKKKKKKLRNPQSQQSDQRRERI